MLNRKRLEICVFIILSQKQSKVKTKLVAAQRQQKNQPFQTYACDVTTTLILLFFSPLNRILQNNLLQIQRVSVYCVYCVYCMLKHAYKRADVSDRQTRRQEQSHEDNLPITINEWHHFINGSGSGEICPSQPLYLKTDAHRI